MAITVFSESGRLIDVAAELGSGGEGVIYALAGNQFDCVKIYTKRLPDVDKLRVMVASGPRDPTIDTRNHRSIAWPSSLIFSDAAGSRCVGFVMPRIESKKFKTAMAYIDSEDRLKQFGGGFTWKYLHVAALNTASAVTAIHESGHCVGDLNESNVLIAPSALVTLIDCDSFQVADPLSGRVFRCPVGKGEYTAPELHGRSYSEVDRTPETDCFALAVFIFQMLMEGTHPYQARGTLVDDAPSTEAKIVKGHFPYDGRRGVTPPAHAPPYEILPPQIQELFRRCFVDGHKRPRARPSASEWFAVLNELLSKFAKCTLNPNHDYLTHLDACPWCIAARKGDDPFPSDVGQQIALDDPNVSLDDLEKRLNYLRSYVSMALADGVLTVEEGDFIVAQGLRLGVPRRDSQKLIQEEQRKLGARVRMPGVAVPVLEVSKSSFEFSGLRIGATTSGSFTVSNTGGGSLIGSITCSRAWLRVAQSQIDATRHRQDIVFSIDTTGLPYGLNDIAAIEMRSNGGTQAIRIQLSTEIPDVALARFRLKVTALAALVGAALGLGLYEVLPEMDAKQAAVRIAVVVGLLLSAVVVAVRKSGLAVLVCGILLGALATVAGVERIPGGIWVIGWSATYAGLLNVMTRRLFVLRQKGARAAANVGVLGAVLVAAAILLGGIAAGPRFKAVVSKENPNGGAGGTTRLLVGLSCDRLSDIRSRAPTQPGSIAFVNRRATSVLVYWIDYAGRLQLYRRLRPNESYVQGSFVEHPWTVKGDGKCLGVWLPEPGPGRVELLPRITPRRKPAFVEPAAKLAEQTDSSARVVTTEATSAEAKTTNVRVIATQPWFGTGVIIRAGSVLRVTATGAAIPCRFDNCGDKRFQRWVGPDGFAWLPHPSGTTFPSMGLVARIGSGPAFYVGKEWYGTIATDGELFLGINDSPGSWSDNDGAFEVTIRDMSAARR